MEAKNNNKNGMNVIENVENEVQVTEESRKAYGRPSVNEEKGWKLDHVIPFDFYHNAYIKSHKGIDELVRMVSNCNTRPSGLLTATFLMPSRSLRRNIYVRATGKTC